MPNPSPSLTDKAAQLYDSHSEVSDVATYEAFHTPFERTTSQSREYLSTSPHTSPIAQTITIKSAFLEDTATSSITSNNYVPSSFKYRFLHRFSNRFRDPQTEESYKVYTSLIDLPIAQRICILLILGTCLPILTFAYTNEICSELPIRHNGYANFTLVIASPRIEDQIFGASCTQYFALVERVATIKSAIIKFAFSPLALCFLLSTSKAMQNRVQLKAVVYWTRRRWACLAVLICTTWATGSYYAIYSVFNAMKITRQQDIETRLAFSKHIVVPKVWYANSQWNETEMGSMRLLDWIVSYNDLLLLSLFGAALVAVSATGVVLALAMKLDYLHAVLQCMFLSISAIVHWSAFYTRIGHMTRNKEVTFSQNLIFIMGLLIPAYLGLTAVYSEDLAARTVYLLKAQADRLNITLKLDLSAKHVDLANRRVPREEQELLEKELEKMKGKDDLLSAVAISFKHIVLKRIMTRTTAVDVLLAELHGKLVVFKRLPVNKYSCQTFRNFRASVETMACLRHPNIVLFIGATFDSLANIGLIFEHMEQGDVYSILRSPIHLTWNDPLLKIATDVAQAMTFLHNSEPRLVHRDLKSANLLCSATYTCKVSDFDNAKYLNNMLTTIVGTAYWLAPEILREEKYDIKVDCYSFGIVLIELETRKDPYHDLKSTNAIEIMRKVATEKLRPTIPTSCAHNRRILIEKCLQDDPAQRPTMTEILYALQHDIRNEIFASEAIAEVHAKNRRMLLQRHQKSNQLRIQDILKD